MIVSQKAALSLLISLLLFAGFTVLAFTGLFNLLETRFYNPSITKSMTREIDEDAQSLEKFLDELQTRFGATLNAAAVQRSFLPNQNSEAIEARAKLYGTLQESLGGFRYVRFVDSGGRRILYSTYTADILWQDQSYVAYRDYNEVFDYIPYGQIEVPDQGAFHFILDESGERIIFAYPFYDSFAIYRGTALFSLSIRAVIEQMVSEGRIKAGEDVSVISQPPGIITGLPRAEKSSLVPLISSVWNDGILSLSILSSGFTETGLALISTKTAQGIFVGRLVNESILSFPLTMKIILLVSFLLTVYLIIFLFFNLRQDNITILRNRLKQLQVSLIREYYDHKGDADWSHWKKELELRREDVRAELKRGMKTKPGEALEIDSFIDKSWNELLAVIGGKTERKTGMDEEQLQTLLNRLLLLNTTQPSFPGIHPSSGAGEAKAVEKAEAIDEQDALENIKHESAPAEDEEAMGTLEEIFDEPVATRTPRELLPKTEAAGTPAGTAPVGDAPDELSLDDLNAMPGGPLEEPEEFSPEDLEVLPDGEPKFQELDLSELDSPDASHEQALDAMAREIEFSPLSEELEKERDDEANSLTEDFEIVSPFSTILSDFPEKETLEQLALLEEEPAQEDTQEIPVEELIGSFAGSLLSQPFQTALVDEIDALEPPEESGEGQEFILERDGVNYVNESLLSPDAETLKKLDPDFQDLIDSVLDKTIGDQA